MDTDDKLQTVCPGFCSSGEFTVSDECSPSASIPSYELEGVKSWLNAVTDLAGLRMMLKFWRNNVSLKNRYCFLDKPDTPYPSVCQVSLLSILMMIIVGQFSHRDNPRERSMRRLYNTSKDHRSVSDVHFYRV